jgi:iron-sulfur cluster assembly protein
LDDTLKNEDLAMVANKPDIKISEKARKHIAQIMKNEGKEGYYLRIGVKSGGCSGLSYYLELKEDTLPNDHIFDFGEFKACIDVFSGMYLNGSELDFKDGLNGTGFTWHNPNATRTCGCGESFSA